MTGGNPESGRPGEGGVLLFLKVVMWTTLVTASSFRSRPKGLIHTKTELNKGCSPGGCQQSSFWSLGETGLEEGPAAVYKTTQRRYKDPNETQSSCKTKIKFD